MRKRTCKYLLTFGTMFATIKVGHFLERVRQTFIMDEQSEDWGPYVSA
jgi:hypothetical protein